MSDYIEGIVQEWSAGDSLGFGAYITASDTKVHVSHTRVAGGQLEGMSIGRLVLLPVEKVHGEFVLVKVPKYM